MEARGVVAEQRTAAAALAALLMADLVATVLLWPEAGWHQPTGLVGLLVMSVAAERWALEVPDRVRRAVELGVLVLAGAIYGGPGAALIAVVTCLVGGRSVWVRVGDAAVYGAAALLAGALLHPGVGDESVVDVLALSVSAGLACGALIQTLVAVAQSLRGRSGGLDVLRRRLGASVGVHVVTGLAAGGLALAAVTAAVPTILLTAIALGVYAQVRSELTLAFRHQRDAAQRAERLSRTQFGVVHALLDTVHARDRMTARHSAAVARYCRLLALEAGCTPGERETVHVAALLHDIGKFTFSDAIFWSGQPLSDEQWRLIRGHPDAGADIVARLDGHEQVAEAIRAHHERMDGKGYPVGLAGKEIPLASRMIAVCDAYDVMVSRDSYRDPISSELAVAELRRVAGTQLDAVLVELFVERVVGGGAAFAHHDDTDLEAELEFERRLLPGTGP